MACDQRAVNRGAARVVPIFLLLIVAYACFAFTKVLCIDFLIRPRFHNGEIYSRKAVAGGLLAGFYVLIIVMVTAFIRLITTILWNPGFTPRGPGWAEQQTQTAGIKGSKWHRYDRRKRGLGAHPEKREGDPSNDDIAVGGNSEKANVQWDASGLEAFYMKDVFVCEPDGKPRWCSTCCQWKTDRTHHCSEAGRCVQKMDHFCPWVGGVVAETSFKFFIQFLLYGTLFAAYTMITMAIYVAELSRMGTTDVNFILTLALSGFLGLFAFGMFASSAHLAATNSTTIESMNRGKVWTLAVLIPCPDNFYASRPPHWTPPFTTVTYPATPSAPRVVSPEQAHRHFAVLHTRPGENPFDLGSYLANMREVMGNSILDWLIPLKLSPCADHSRHESAYALGPVVQKIKGDVGLDEWDRHVRARSGDQVSHSWSQRSTAGSSNAAVRGHSLSETSSESRSQRDCHRTHRSAHGSRSAVNSETTSSQGQAQAGRE